MASRVAASMRLDPPPALPGPDELDRTAQQVRLDYPEAVVHRVNAANSDPGIGAVYWTDCTEVLSKAEGAILTTRKPDCHFCLTGERRPNR